MGTMKKLINKIKKKLSSSSDDYLDRDLRETIHQDSRRHNRYSIIQSGCCFAMWSNERFEIANLSYGGVSLINKNGKLSDLSQGVQATLYLPGVEIDAFLRKKHTYSDIVGFGFYDLPVESILKLKAFQNRLEGGASLNELASDKLKEKYQGKGWKCLRGNGPTDLILKTKDSNPSDIEELLLTFREEETYFELRFWQGAFSTGHSIDKTGAGSRMESDAKMDRTIGLKALNILLGIERQELIECMGPLLKRLEKELS